MYEQKKSCLKGYILLESLMALTCLCGFVFLYLDGGLALQKKQIQQNVQLEVYRGMYELSQFQRYGQDVPPLSKTFSGQSLTVSAELKKISGQVGEDYFEVVQTGEK